MKTLTFEIAINASRTRVWTTMLDAESYRLWTAPFCEGSYFVGSWDQGAKIQFLSPSGDGMTSVIAENRPYEYVSVRHLGMIEKGVEDTTSEKVRSWAPAYERYQFEDAAGGCRVIVKVDTLAEYEKIMNEAYPKALARLKELCEE